MNELTHIDLFSGIGGFALAARWAGIKTVQFVEIDKFCHKVLKKNFPGVPIHDDIKTFHYGEKEQWLEYAQNVEKEKLRLIGRIANRVTQSELWSGETKTEISTEKTQGNGAKGKNKKSSVTTAGNVLVVENPEESSSQSTTSTTTEMQNVENTNPKHGNLRLKEDCQMTIKSSATTAITQSQITEYAHIKEVKNEPIFILTAGVPCQPASCAGKRKGHTDDRWLWEETFRVIAEVKPQWCILENVSGILTLEQGVVFDYLLTSLESKGYSVQTYIIPACAVNAPHRRDRVWILGRRQDADDTEGRGCGLLHTKDIGQTSVQVNAPSVPDCHAPDTSDTGFQGRQKAGNASINRQESRNKLAGRLSCWQEPWLEVATRLCRVDDGVSQELYKLETSDRVARLKALGNAIVPQVAYEIMKSILKVENES